MHDMLSKTPEELAEAMAELGQPRFRGMQIFTALHQGAEDTCAITVLPKELRARLSFPRPVVAQRQISEDKTEKLLYRLSDGETVESVLLDYNGEKTICLSTQVGCRQGCAFCASTVGGKVRNLTAGEMLGQLLYCGHPVKRAVLMGIGEPLDNYHNTLRFLRLLSHPKGRNMSLRHVSLSTCGLAPEILRLADEGLPVTLSISLHASNDECRSRLMPINKKYNLTELMVSCKMYFEKTGRRNSYEYVMIENINDSARDAERLAALLAGQPGHVNLIALNPVEGKAFVPSPPEVIKRFANILTAGGISVTLRRRLGDDIDAACGQLRRKHTGKTSGG